MMGSRVAHMLSRAALLVLLAGLWAVPSPAGAQTGVTLLLGRPSIPSGGYTLGLVLLSAPASEGGSVVTLASSLPDVVAVPASVSVPAGQVLATFLVATTPVSITTPVVITATTDSGISALELVLWGTATQRPAQSGDVPAGSPAA